VTGDSRTFNPTLDDAVVAAQMTADPAAAASEWGGQFRADLSSYLSDGDVDGALELGRPMELPPRRGVAYSAFTDPAGGGSSANADSYTLAIGHREDDDFVVDLIRGTRGRHDPAAVTAEYARVLKFYGISKIVGDCYAAAWCSGAWRSNGITYEQSELTRSEIFLEVEPLFVRGVVRMPDHPVLLREFRLLEKRAARSGRQDVGHPRGGHDDHCNAVAGVLWRISARPPMQISRETLENINVRLRQMNRRSPEDFWGERKWAQMQRARMRRFG
jgi:hypothetical protein